MKLCGVFTSREPHREIAFVLSSTGNERPSVGESGSKGMLKGYGDAAAKVAQQLEEWVGANRARIVNSKISQTQGETTAQPPASNLALTQTFRSVGVQRLDGDSVKQAIAAGEAHEPEIYSPPMMRANAMYDKDLKKEIPYQVDADARLMNALKSPPFMVIIETPFLTVAGVAHEAKRKFAQMPPVDLRSVNAGIIVHVSPGPMIPDADAVENVVLKKNDQLIKALVADVKPTTIRSAMGLTKELSEGRFLFPIEAFQPDAPLTIIVVGRSANWEWTITAGELGKLR